MHKRKRVVKEKECKKDALEDRKRNDSRSDEEKQERDIFHMAAVCIGPKVAEFLDR